MQRPVMGAPVIHILENQVGIGGEGAIGEEHRLDPAAQLVIGQKQQILAAKPADTHLFLHDRPFSPAIWQPC